MPQLPPGNKERLETSVSRTRCEIGTVSSGLSAHSKSLRPQVFATSKILCSLGRRRSPSIRSTLRPISAIAILRLQATVVLPSPGHALVRTMIRGPSPFWPGERIEIRVVRAHSASKEGLRFQVASSGQSPSEDLKALSGGREEAKRCGGRRLGICQETAVRSKGKTPNSGKSK